MTPAYIAVRTVVRCLFWVATAVLVGWLISFTMDDRPPCPIRIVSPTEWEWTEEAKLSPIELTECVAPQYMVLHPDFSWDWVKE